ncbi:hypothetical protein LWI29_029326 [Acer saccharum]|uniref:Retrotransposon Copia-like N-terminal domain-containing protein n=1 Tax=Acer saccharum TaxID=4024 RepID=A0AA39SGF5_ACESA|nr:hypothetical protein LWI29_029326 [Acer saccharum]
MTVAETPPTDSPSHPSAAAPNIPRHSNEHSVDESILSRGLTPTTATEQANTNDITLTSRRSSRPTRLPSHLRDYEVNHSKLLAPGSSSSVMSGTPSSSLRSSSVVSSSSSISMGTLGSGNSQSSTGKSAIDEPSSPYFLHHSDSPGLVLVSQSLTRDNYAS